MPDNMIFVSASMRRPKEERERSAQTGERLAQMILGLVRRDSLMLPCEEVSSFLRSQDVINLCEAIAARHPEWLDPDEARAHWDREIGSL